MRIRIINPNTTASMTDKMAASARARVRAGTEIVAVDVKNRVAQVTVRFLSHLITATRNAQGEVTDGSAEAVVEVPDVWTFARTLGTRDPNWQLVATEAGA